MLVAVSPRHRRRRRRRGARLQARGRAGRRTFLLGAGSTGAPRLLQSRTAPGVPDLLDAQRGVHQGARRRSQPPVAGLRRDACSRRVAEPSCERPGRRPSRPTGCSSTSPSDCPGCVAALAVRAPRMLSSRSKVRLLGLAIRSRARRALRAELGSRGPLRRWRHEEGLPIG